MTNIQAALAVPGWMEPASLRWLAHAASRAHIVVECGAWQGRTTRVLADHCTGKVYTIDDWQTPCLCDDGTLHHDLNRVRAQFELHLAEHLRRKRVVVLQGLTREVLPRLLAKLGGKVDLLFLDADHRREAIAEDIRLSLPLVRAGGILAGHDYHNPTWPGVTAAVDAAFGTVRTGGHMIWWVRR